MKRISSRDNQWDNLGSLWLGPKGQEVWIQFWEGELHAEEAFSIIQKEYPELYEVEEAIRNPIKFLIHRGWIRISNHAIDLIPSSLHNFKDFLISGLNEDNKDKMFIIEFIDSHKVLELTRQQIIDMN